MFAFKPCEYCTTQDAIKKEDGTEMTYDELCELFNQESNYSEEVLAQSCKRAHGKHFVITYCQKVSLQDIYDHNAPGYLEPNQTHVKGISLEKVADGFAGMGHFGKTRAGNQQY